METNFDQLFEKVTQNLKDFASTETVIGEEFKIGEFTCKPVIKIGMGYGGGSGTGDDPKSKCAGSGSGIGAGMGIAPVGFLVVKNGEISFIPANNKKGLSDIFDKVPDLMEKIIEMKAKKEKEEAGKK